MDIVSSEPLRHNQYNAVTTSIDKVETADGRTLVRKRLGRVKAGSPDHWQASDDPHHWNAWRREADAYTSESLRASLEGTGLEMPPAVVEEDDDGITLWIDFVPGVAGTDFDLGDHQALARGLGRWQAQGPIDEPWCSTGFLRAYSGSKPAPYELLADDHVWSLPIVRDHFPGMLREGWTRLVANRERLLGIMETLPRTRCHLDVWASNAARRLDGTVVLFDWSFTGDGTFGEDAGNQVPDGVFDLFWPAERIGELDEAVSAAYLDGLRLGGWDGDHREVRLGMTAACVKYAWLLPQMLAEASDPVAKAYWREVEPTFKYAARGQGMARMVNWCDEALRLADQLGEVTMLVDDPQVPGWEVADGALRRDFAFADFSEAFAFMTRVALIAERLNHHPDWSNSWSRVSIAVSSHDEGGITELCIDFATRVNRLVGE